MAVPEMMESAWAEIDSRDVDELISNTEPGPYTSQSLYEVYCEVATKNGRLPASHKAFGIAMKNAGNVSVRSRGLRGWLIPERP